MYEVKWHQESILQVKIELHRNSESNTAIKYIELLKRSSLGIEKELERYLFLTAVAKKSSQTLGLNSVHLLTRLGLSCPKAAALGSGQSSASCKLPGETLLQPVLCGCESCIASTLWPPESSVRTASGYISRSPTPVSLTDCSSLQGSLGSHQHDHLTEDNPLLSRPFTKHTGSPFAMCGGIHSVWELGHGLLGQGHYSAYHAFSVLNREY